MSTLRVLFLLVIAQGLQAAPFLYVAESGTSLVRVIDTANDAVVAHIGVGHGPRDIAINAERTRAYVLNSGEATVSAIDMATNRVIATIGVGENPTAIAVNPAGSRVYVAARGRYPGFQGSGVSVIDAQSNTVIATIAAPGISVGLAVTPDGARLYVANSESQDISVIDTSTNMRVATIAVGSHPEGGLAMNASGSRLYVTLPFAAALIAIDTATNAVVGRLQEQWDPHGIALNPAGTRAYVADAGSDFFAGRTLYVIDTASLTVVSKVVVDASPFGVSVSPSGGLVYVASPGADTVAVVDAATNAVVKKVAVGRFPLATGLGSADAMPAGGNYQGLWWNSPAGSESGWGVNLTHQGDILFGTWSTYDTDGRALWLVMPNGARTSASTYSGALFRMTTSSSVLVGNATFAFTSVDTGTFTYTVNGTTQSKAIARYAFASPMPICTAGGRVGTRPSYQDLWWRSPAGSEPGWGVNITQQGSILFATWFTYGVNGRAEWLVMSKGVLTSGGNAYTGALYRTTGPPFDASPWNSAQVSAAAVGTATFTFDSEDPDNANFAYTLEGASRSVPITRYVFSSPATVCR